MVERLVGGDVEAAALLGDNQFDLVMQVLGQRRVGDVAPSATSMSPCLAKKNGGAGQIASSHG